MKIDKDQLGLNLLWGIPTFLVTFALCSWYLIASWQAHEWLGGGSAAGISCGIAAGVVIAFEMLLWPRKFLRRFRFIRARHWLLAHVYFGLASLPLAILHTGFHWGGNLPTLFIVLFILTIFSGVYGLILQNVLPRFMLRQVPAETIYSQIEFVSARTVDDLHGALRVACGASPFEQPADAIEQAEEDADGGKPGASAVIVGAVREVGRVRGRTISTATLTAAKEDHKTLWVAFREMQPYLIEGKQVRSPLRDDLDAQRWFIALRKSCHPGSEQVIALLEQARNQRRQFDVQRSIHRWLHAWIPFHVGLSVAVTILLIAHVWTALKYW